MYSGCDSESCGFISDENLLSNPSLMACGFCAERKFLRLFVLLLSVSVLWALWVSSWQYWSMNCHWFRIQQARPSMHHYHRSDFRQNPFHRHFHCQNWCLPHEISVAYTWIAVSFWTDFELKSHSSFQTQIRKKVDSFVHNSLCVCALYTTKKQRNKNQQNILRQGNQFESFKCIVHKFCTLHSPRSSMTMRPSHSWSVTLWCCRKISYSVQPPLPLVSQVSTQQYEKNQI